MNLPLMLAWRIYRHGGDVKRISRPAVRIATLGVALGVAVMIISVAVVIGFKREIEQKVIGMGSHIQVFNGQMTDDYATSPIVLSDSAIAGFRKIKGVSHVQRFSVKPGMLKTEDSFDGIMLRGYGSEFDSRFLQSHLVEGKFEDFADKSAIAGSTSATAGNNSASKIYVSQSVAKRLKLKVGSKVYSYFFDKELRVRRPEIGGIYATNIKEFDNTIVFADLGTVNQLSGFQDDEYTGLEIHVSDFSRLDEVNAQVSRYVSHLRANNQGLYTAKTVRQLYAPIFSWLTMLDTNIWVILALMTAVAVVTMISGLLIIILEQTQFIGTMKALGARNGMLRRLFLYLSVFIIGKGVIIGNIISLLLIFIQQQTGLVKLDSESYYVSQVPVDLNWTFVLGINLSTILISVLVLIIPSYLISKIHPARSIRFE